MDDGKLNKLYSNLLIDPDFEKLELIRNRPNIFEILGVNHYEIRHSNFLAWLLSPFGSHGIDEYFIKRIMLDVFQDSRSIKNVIDIHDLLKEDIIVHREKHNIDVLVEFQSTVIVIENKINAKEGKYQLQTYHDLIKEKYGEKDAVFIYLTKYGDEASINEFIELSYNHIINYLKDLIEYKRENISEEVLIYINDYLDNLNKNVMKQDPANILADTLYKRHQELFDFIIVNKTNYRDEFGRLLSDFFSYKKFIIGSYERGYVRFTTQKLADLYSNSPCQKIPWENSEPFLFEIVFKQKGKFLFMATTSSSNLEIKNVLNNILETIPENCRKDSGGWTNFLNKKIKREQIKNILQRNREEISTTFEQLLAEILPLINLVESKLIEHQEKIKNLN